MFSPIPTQLPLLFRYPRNMIAVAFGVATLAGVTTFLFTRRKLSPAEIERARRDHLALIGRITDGSITETQWFSDSADDGPAATPCLLIYRYSIGGVTYECAQDVSHISLADHLRHVRIDLPIQVRFDPRNPGNSIVVSETWTGLRFHTAANVDHTQNSAP